MDFFIISSIEEGALSFFASELSTDIHLHYQLILRTLSFHFVSTDKQFQVVAPLSSSQYDDIIPLIKSLNQLKLKASTKAPAFHLRVNPVPQQTIKLFGPPQISLRFCWHSDKITDAVFQIRMGCSFAKKFHLQSLLTVYKL